MNWKTENFYYFIMVAVSIVTMWSPMPNAATIGLFAAVFFIGMIIANTKMNRHKEKDAKKTQD